MAGNTIGQLFRVTTFGESHGLMIGCVIDGMPPGMKLSIKDLQYELNRRKPGNSIYTSQRNEHDKIKIISGIFNGKTTGTPICLLIKNTDHNTKDYDKIKNLFRPGHADYTYQKKYGIRDYRGGGRSSARETAMRVAAGAIAKKYLKEKLGITIRGYLSQIGNIICELKDWKIVEKNPFFCPDPTKIQEIKQLLSSLILKGDSIGSKITVIAKNVPIGLGEPVFDKLDADIAHALMSINAAKCVEIGNGYQAVTAIGSKNCDEINNDGFLSNNAGGILGGISNSQPIIAHVTFKPTSSIRIPLKTIDIKNHEKEIVTVGRHDPCIGIRAVPITEAMISIIIFDHYLRYKGQCG